MLTGYCIRRAADGAPPPGVTGVDGAPLLQLEEGELALWASEGDASTPTLERLAAHDMVVRAALRTATPLPLRFGTHFAGDDAARAVLRERAAEFDAALRRVAGRVEMGVRVLWRSAADPPAPPGGPAPVPRSGREYLELRRRELLEEEARRARDEALLDRVEAFFPDFPASRREGGEPGLAGSLAHLVQVGELAHYRALFHAARAALDGAELVLTGPWAPYSFV